MGNLIQTNLPGGLALVLVAGAMCGNAMTPMRAIRNWKWENAWLIFSVVSLLLVPGLLALLLVPHLASVYSQAAASDLLVPFLFGAGWGIAQVFFGISIANLGMALGFSVIIGLGALFGTLVPVLVQHQEVLQSAKGGYLLAGTLVMLLAVSVCGYAGQKRERRTAAGKSVATRASSYRAALALAILCGVMSPMINFALAFGQGIMRQSEQLGAAPANTPFAVWPVALLGGLIPNAAYCIYLIRHNRSLAAFRSVWPDAGYATLMGILWMGAVAIYGVATRLLGPLGTSAGWGLFQIFMILAANISGMIQGEWSNAGKRCIGTLLAGTALLFVATVLISASNM